MRKRRAFPVGKSPRVSHGGRTKGRATVAGKRDYYEVLGIQKGASADDIKKAFREIAKKHHPDRNPGNKESEDILKAAAEAYSVLSDPEKKAMYDRFGTEMPGMGGRGGFDPSQADIFSSMGDLFEEMFGGAFGGRGRGQRARRGRDLQMELELDLEEAAKGVTRELEIQKNVACETCAGSGAKPGTQPQTCPTCAGRGAVSHSQGLFAFSTTCPRCHGEGRIVKDACESCRGSGATRKKRKLKIEIPAGVDEGNRVQIGGEGEPGDRGGPAGDLFLLIRLKEHELFTRDGEHLLCTVPVQFAQAALGAKIEVPTLDGKREVELPAGTQSGDTIVVKGAGFPRPGRTLRGDEIVQIQVVTPKKLSARQRELLEELAKLDGAAATSEDDGLVGKIKKKFRGKTA